MTSPANFPPPPKGKNGWPWTTERDSLEDSEAVSIDCPKITIVTPSFNQGMFIEATIRSVLLQNYSNLEYIIVDGGSTDNSTNVIKKYESWISYWVSEPDNGQYDAINKGFSVSTGEIMLWLNSDDMLVSGSLQALGGIFRSLHENVRWVTGCPFYWDVDGNMYRIINPFIYNRRLMQIGGYNSRAIGWVMQEGTAWCRSLWDDAGGYVDSSLTYAADFDLWHRFSFYDQLYSVSSLIGGNRCWPGQKTADVASYDREIDRILRRRRFCRFSNILLRNRYLRSCIRIYLSFSKTKTQITYDPRAMRWQLGA